MIVLRRHQIPVYFFCDEILRNCKIVLAFSNVLNDRALYICLLSWLLIVPVALSLPRPAAREAAEKEKEAFLPQLRKLLSNKAFVLILCCAMLNNVAANPVTGYFSMIVQSLGGDMFQTGVGMFVQAFSEFFVIYYFSRLCRRWKVKDLYIFGVIMTIVRSIAMAMARTPWEAVAFATLQSVSFGLTMPSQTLMVNDSAEASFKAAALQVVSMGTSISSMIMSPVQGMVSDRFGMPVMLVSFTLFAFIELGVLFLFYKDLPDPSRYS